MYTAAWYNTDTRDNLNSLQSLGVCGFPFGQSASSSSANVATFVRIWLRAFAVTSFEINISTSTGNIDVGIYTDSAGSPLTRLWSRGSFASPGTGQQSILISAGSPASLTTTSGPAWAALSCSSGSFAVNAMHNSPKGLVKTMAAAHPLPATASSLSDSESAFGVALL